MALELAEPVTVDSSEIRAILNRDPFWCLYALGDLDPHGHLVAAAGTHLLNESEGVAGVGNVFCHHSPSPLTTALTGHVRWIPGFTH